MYQELPNCRLIRLVFVAFAAAMDKCMEATLAIRHHGLTRLVLETLPLGSLTLWVQGLDRLEFSQEWKEVFPT